MKYFIYVFLIFSICLFVQVNVLGQDSKVDTSFVTHRYAVKLSPFSLLPLPLSSMQLGFEHKLKNSRHALQYEAGALFPFPYNLLSSNFRRMGGFRTTSGYRYYINKPTKKFNFFTSTQYRLQYESWNLSNWFDRYNGSYQQKFDYQKKVMSHGLLVSFGGNKKAKRSNFLFEWEIGFGAKSRTIFNRGIPSDATSNDDSSSILEIQFDPTSAETAQTKILPIVLSSIKFGFIIP